MTISARRPTGHITDLVRRLSKWRDRRAAINAREVREGGKRLPNTELDEAIQYLEEYRELVAKGGS